MPVCQVFEISEVEEKKSEIELNSGIDLYIDDVPLNA